MTKITIEVKKQVEVITLKVEACVRYWEDSTVKDIEDKDGKLIPCRDGDQWAPLINLKEGLITNWEKGVSAEIHYKICDAGDYYLLDENCNVIVHLTDGYVPSMLSPKSNGYGDYIIMDVDVDGFIKDWSVDLIDFINE